MKKGLVGLAKYSILVLAFAAIISFAALNMGGVSAVHTSTVAISPKWVDTGTEYTFTVTVTHDTGPDNIREVRIYN
ncbi:MAG: hypothetical protein MUP55_01785, partial [Candidatus Aenigmarchaeota archaeon]|nr:hypothetical protein [Candidatus Aenigmarchaeota archaeon]